MQASARRMGGIVAGSRRLNEASVAIDETARQLRHPVFLRAKVSYGGPDSFYGFVVPYDGIILGMTIILEKMLTSGLINFHFRVNGEDANVESITFSTTTDLIQLLELSTPLDVEAGDVVEIGVLESRFAGDFPSTTEAVLPNLMTAGITIMMQY